MTVHSLADSMEWYKMTFHFEFLEGDLADPEVPWAIVGRNDTMLCLYEYPALKRIEMGTGAGSHRIFHFGLRISERKEWEDKVQELNLPLLYGGLREYPHSVSWYVQDPSGHIIEVSYAGDKPLKF